MFTKEEKREGKGGPVRGTRRESREPTGCWGKGATHNAQRRRALHDAAATRKRDDNGPDTDGVRRARSEMTQHAKHGQLKIGFGTRRPL